MRVSIQQYAADLRQPRHAHDTMSVTLLLAGSLREEVGRADVIARPLSVVVKPVDVEHANTFGAEGARTVQVVLDTQEARALVESNTGFSQWRWTHAGRATPAFLALASAIQRSDARLTEQCTIEVLAAAAVSDRGHRTPPEWIARIREHIEDEPHATSLSTLAHNADVHPVYLARRFRECYGISVTDFRKRCRVQRVAQLLTAPQAQTLSGIAHDTGYSDHSHMCREFRTIAGLSPSSFRDLIIA